MMNIEDIHIIIRKIKKFIEDIPLSLFAILFLLYLPIKLYVLFVMPESFDESIYVYKTYLMTEGWDIYKDFGDNRMPGFLLMLYPFMYVYKILVSPPYENVIYFARIYAIVASFISIIFIFKIGKYLRNGRTGFIAAILFMISPFALGRSVYVYFENFLATFSVIGLYFFIKAIECDENKENEMNIFLAGIFFGLAVLMKQMALLIFPVVTFILLTKYGLNKTFVQRTFVNISGGLLIGSVILIYLLFNDSVSYFISSMSVSVQEADMWANPSKKKMINDYIVPSLNASDMLTLIFGFIGTMYSLSFFFFRRYKDFGIKTIVLWFVSYNVIMYTFSNNYPFYYIPMLPPLVVISAYMMNNFLELSARIPKYKKIFMFLATIILLASFYHNIPEYRKSLNPTVNTSAIVFPLGDQISVGKYLYNNTNDGDKIFSIDPIYGLIAKRDVVNHFTSGTDGLTGADEMINRLRDDKVKYAVIDDRSSYHLRTKWTVETIRNLHILLEIKIENEENPSDGVVVELRNEKNAALWWIHAKDWKIPDNKKNLIHYSIPIEVGEWKKIDINLSNGFDTYFNYTPKEYKLFIWANANNNSNIVVQVDNMSVWDENNIFLQEDFDKSSLEKFYIAIEGKRSDDVESGSKSYIKDGKLIIESFNENRGLYIKVSTGVLGYILENFEKEKEFNVEKVNRVIFVYKRIEK